jgi:hypothetical protein
MTGEAAGALTARRALPHPSEEVRMVRPNPRRSVAVLVASCSTVALLAVAGHARAATPDTMPAPPGAIPQQATTVPPTPTATPMPTATPCTGERWRIQVHVFPDDVGGGIVRWPPRRAISGCDGFFTDGDRLAATGHGIDPVWVVVTNAAGTAVLDSKVFGRQGANVDATNLFTLCQPPPYVVQLVTTRQRSRVLCPDQPHLRLLTDAHFTAGLMGRLALVNWGFVEASP